MKIQRQVFLGLLASALFLSVGLGACGGDNNEVLTISPPGPVLVEKGSTQQFTANLAGVTWAVEGGAGNGTISADGLYTPPATLPLDPQATVVASLPGEEATALVELRTADTIAFPPLSEPPTQVNDTSIPSSAVFLSLLIGGVGDHLAVSLGSVHVNATWTQGDTTVADAFFSQSHDFGPFDPERNLSASNVNNLVPASIENDDDLNPQILLVVVEPETTPTPSPVPQISFMQGENQGASFSAPVPIAPGTDSQTNGVMRRDANGGIHAVFAEGVIFSGVAGGTIFYVRSDDNGESWSTPVPVAPPPTAPAGFAFPFLAVDEAGEEIHVCFTNFPDITAIDVSVLSATRSVDGGTSFSPPLEFPTASDNADLFCRNAMAPNGDVYVVFSRESTTDDGQVLFSASTDGGASYSEPKAVNSEATGTQAFGILSVDSLGRVDVVWGSETDGGGNLDTLMYARSSNGGVDFSANVPIAEGGESAIPMGLRHDESGRVHVQFLSDVNDPGNNVDIFYLVGQ